MNGRIFASITTTVIWITIYVASMYFVNFKFSAGNISRHLRDKTTDRMMFWIGLGTTITAPVLSGFMFRIGGLIDRGKHIAWGCYIEDFWIIIMFLWFFGLIILTMMLPFAIYAPHRLRFLSRKEALWAYLIHNIYTLIISILIGYLIPVLSGPLSGKGSSCL